MLNLNQSLTDIEKQRTLYRILLNRSRYKRELQKAEWQRAATLLPLSQKKHQRVNTNKIFVQECEGTQRAFESARENVMAPQLTVENIMGWHTQMLKGIAPHAVGQFRHGRAYWLMSTMLFANWEKIPYLMDNLVDSINKQHIPALYWKERPDRQFQNVSHNPLVTAIEANYNLVAIHPFQDGNKRTARLVASWVLGRQGYVPLCIYDNMTYIDCIEAYTNTRKPHAFYGFLLDQMHQSYEDAIKEAKSMEKVIVPGTRNGARVKCTKGMAR